MRTSGGRSSITRRKYSRVAGRAETIAIGEPDAIGIISREDQIAFEHPVARRLQAPDPPALTLAANTIWPDAIGLSVWTRTRTFVPAGA